MRIGVPIGYVWHREVGLGLDPDLRVQEVIRFIFARPFYGGDLVQQMDAIGVQSLGIVLLTGFFTGMVLALQSSVQLQAFGAQIYIGRLVSASMIRHSRRIPSSRGAGASGGGMRSAPCSSPRRTS